MDEWMYVCIYMPSIIKMQLYTYKLVKSRIDKHNNNCDVKHLTKYTNLAVRTTNPFRQLLPKEEDLPFRERIRLPILEESSLFVQFRLDIRNNMADNSGAALPHKIDFDISKDRFC